LVLTLDALVTTADAAAIIVVVVVVVVIDIDIDITSGIFTAAVLIVVFGISDSPPRLE